MINASSLTIKIINTLPNGMQEVIEHSEYGTPQLRYNGGDERHQYLMPSELSFSMEVENATDLHFAHLFTGNETQYQVVVENQNNDVIWRGYLLPEQYAEPYEHARFFVQFTATDGLGRLKNKYLPDSYFRCRHSVVSVMQGCLAQTGLSLPLHLAPALRNDHGTIGGDWNKIFIDCRTYQNDQGKRDDCYKILTALLEVMGCSLLTINDAWYCTGHNRLTAAPFMSQAAVTYYTYNTDNTFDKFTDISWASYEVNLAATPQISLLPPYQRVIADWAIDEQEELIPENYIKQPDQVGGLLYNPEPVRYWTASAVTQMGKYVLRLNSTPPSYSSGTSFGGALTAHDLNVLNSLTGDSNPVMRVQGASTTQYQGVNNNAGYFMTLERGVYLTSELDTIDIKLEMVFVIDGVSNDTINNDQFLQLWDDEKYNNDIMHYEVLINDTPIVSNRPLFTDREAFFLDISNEYRTEGVFDNQAKLVVGKLDLEGMRLPNDGYLNVKIYYGQDPDDELYIVRTGVRLLDIKYSADDVHVYSLQQDIDWSTRLEIDLMHGDNKMDILQSHLTLHNYDTNLDNYSEVPITGPYQNAIASPYKNHWELPQAAAAAAVQNALSLGRFIYMQPPGTSVMLRIDTTLSNFLASEFNAFNGTTVHLIRLETVTGDLFYTGCKLFTYDQAPPVVIPRSSRVEWSRMGKVGENKPFVQTRAQVALDTHHQPLVKVDSELFGLHSPIGLKAFNIGAARDFVVTDCTLNLDDGMTQVTMVESVQSAGIPAVIIKNPVDY